MAHGKWSEVEAQGVLEAWRRSGMTLERFAKQRGLVSNDFCGPPEWDLGVPEPFGFGALAHRAC